VHVIDPINASRTLLYDLHRGCWDDALCARFAVPRKLLPEIRPSIGDFGTVDPHLAECALPIRGVAGDQQAAAVGQVCLTPGTVKATYGTGCFVLLHTGNQIVASQHRLLSTVAIGTNSSPAFALEGSIFNAGTVMQWMRDELGLMANAADSATLAASIPDSGGVHVVPAFTGLGAPWWDADARGIICGLTRATSRAHIVRAGLEAIAHQTEDLLDAMRADGGHIERLRIDGGMVANDWFCAFLSDQLGVPVERPHDTETTVRGAAMLAAVGCGILPSLASASSWWTSERIFTPDPSAPRAERRAAWLRAVARTR
jgi:glycerol kinase